MTERTIYGIYKQMAVSRNYRHGQTANPVLIGLVVGIIVWLVLTLAGNDEVVKSVLAVLKEASVWVAVFVGGLVFIWAWRMRQMEMAAERGAENFREWSAALPQWKPIFAAGETAAFVVPLARVEAGEYSRREPGPVKVATEARAELGLVPVTNTRSVPVMRLAPLQEMADRFAAAQQFMTREAESRMPLAPVSHGGLVRAARVEIPQVLPLEKVAALPRTELEQLAGECYRRQGYDVAALGHGDAESGVDLLCQGRGEVILVKCVPSDDGDVSLEEVRELLSLVMGEGATRGIVVTSGMFSRKAIKFAHRKGRGRIELINGRQFASMLQASAAGAGASPACPCCGGRMKMEMEKKWFGRSEWSWNCEGDGCPGVIRQEDALPERKLLAA
jgi:hypothetical protein